MPAPIEIDPRVVKAIGHPMRQRIIGLLYERPRSAKELARAMRQPVPNIVHHLRVLEDVEAVDVAETIEHKGTIERRYRLLNHLWLRANEIEQLPAPVRDALMAPIAAAIMRDFGAAVAAGKLASRADVTNVRIPLDIDEQGWREAYDVLVEAAERVVEIRDAAHVRLRDRGGEPVRGEVVLLQFERAPET